MQLTAFTCLFLASAAALQLSSPPQLRPLRTRSIRLQADEPETGAKTDEEGAALAAAFKARLDEEGGETAFRLKSDANNLAESAKETASAAGSKIANLLDVGGRRAGPGMMDPGSWNLTVAFFVGLIVVSVAGAVVNRPPSGGNDPYIYNNAGYGGIDKFTSDGQPLEFGSRY